MGMVRTRISGADLARRPPDQNADNVEDLVDVKLVACGFAPG
jgi:hypothetical protein